MKYVRKYCFIISNIGPMLKRFKYKLSIEEEKESSITILKDEPFSGCRFQTNEEAIEIHSLLALDWNRVPVMVCSYWIE